MNWREVPVEEAMGLSLAYDLTEIVPGKSKGAVLRRGHVIGASDVSILKRIGKSVLRVLELEDGEVHEDEAASSLARIIAGSGLEVRMPGEAWADLRTTRSGLLKVNTDRLNRINLIGDLLVTTRQSNTPVDQGDIVAKAKALGLVTQRQHLEEARRIGADGAVLSVLPFLPLRAGLVITGNEVFGGRIEDAFTPLLTERLKAYGSSVGYRVVVRDDPKEVAKAIRSALTQGVDLVLATGGMSPDDTTPDGIRRTDAEVVFHGVPASPGTMTILAYAGSVPIMGVPAGILAKPRAILDLLLPRLLAGERLERKHAVAYAHGGLCWGCKICVFPACPLGKGA